MKITKRTNKRTGSVTIRVKAETNTDARNLGAFVLSGDLQKVLQIGDAMQEAATPTAVQSK